jgi:hypothetical protein
MMTHKSINVDAGHRTATVFNFIRSFCANDAINWLTQAQSPLPLDYRVLLF